MTSSAIALLGQEGMLLLSALYFHVTIARCEYTLKDLGPNRFRAGGVEYTRTDFELRNPRDLKIQVSHYEPAQGFRPKPKLPCVIYLHGNCMMLKHTSWWTLFLTVFFFFFFLFKRWKSSRWLGCSRIASSIQHHRRYS